MNEMTVGQNIGNYLCGNWLRKTFTELKHILQKHPAAFNLYTDAGCAI
jgi:hypothetical protein